MSPDDPKPHADRPPPIPPAEVAEFVRSIVGQSGPVIPSKHFRLQGRERDFGIQDGWEVLRNFVTNPTPVWNDLYGAWNYDIEGLDIEGEQLTVRIAFSETKTKIILVTAF